MERLHAANGMDWGAYFGLATRRSGLTRWQRGDMNALVEVPALIADIDEPPNVALPRVQAFSIQPSCIVSSGHGLHAYWLLAEPTTDMQAVNAIHRGLASALKGDYLTAATALRLSGSMNTKHTMTVPCEVLQSNWSRYYKFADFEHFRKAREHPKSQQSSHTTRQRNGRATLNPHLIQQVADELLARGYKWREAWLNGPCPHACHHKHADARPSFGYVESKLKSRGGIESTHKEHANLPKSTLDYLVYGAAIGQRNNALFAAACQFRDAHYTLAECCRVLVPRYLADSVAGEATQTRRQEAQRTIQSVYSRPARSPVRCASPPHPSG